MKLIIPLFCLLYVACLFVATALSEHLFRNDTYSEQAGFILSLTMLSLIIYLSRRFPTRWGIGLALHGKTVDEHGFRRWLSLRKSKGYKEEIAREVEFERNYLFEQRAIAKLESLKEWVESQRHNAESLAKRYSVDDSENSRILHHYYRSTFADYCARLNSIIPTLNVWKKPTRESQEDFLHRTYKAEIAALKERIVALNEEIQALKKSIGAREDTEAARYHKKVSEAENALLNHSSTGAEGVLQCPVCGTGTLTGSISDINGQPRCTSIHCTTHGCVDLERRF